MIQLLTVVVAVGLVVAIAAVAFELWMPALLDWLEWLKRRRSNQPDRSRAVATDPTLEAEKQRLAELNAQLAAAETSLGERERQISAKLDELTAAQRERIDAAAELVRHETALAERQRILEQSQADAEKSAAEERARIEARQAALKAKEAELQRQESELTNGSQPSAADPDLSWWEKQLGGPSSPKE